MLVLCPIFDRVELLPFFLKHYQNLGATEFVFALFNGKRNPSHGIVRGLCLEMLDEATPFTICESYSGKPSEFNGIEETKHLNMVRTSLADGCKWLCIADLDEFIYLPDGLLPDYERRGDVLGWDAFHGVFHERIASDGSFPEVPKFGTANLEETFPMASDISICCGANQNKANIMRSRCEIKGGHHSVDGAMRIHALEVHHFKWTCGIEQRLRATHSRLTSQHIPWADESRLLLEHLAAKRHVTPEFNYRPARRVGI